MELRYIVNLFFAYQLPIFRLPTTDFLSTNYRFFVHQLPIFCPSPIAETRINTEFAGSLILYKSYKSL